MLRLSFPNEELAIENLVRSGFAREFAEGLIDALNATPIKLEEALPTIR